jgi:uncharacterized repeat protein (TIGR01451 family)
MNIPNNRVAAGFSTKLFSLLSVPRRSVAAAAARGRWAALALIAASSYAIAANPVVNAVFTTSGITTSVPASNHTTIQFTISNLAGDAATVVGFTETLPGGLVVAATPNVGGTCVGATVGATAGSTTITVSNLSVPAGPSSCTITVDVAAAGGGAASGNYNASCASFPVKFTTLPTNITTTTNITVDSTIQSCVTVGTYPSLESPADRFGGKLNCTANDVSLGNINVVGTTQCIFGLPITLQLTGDINVTANNRYDIGIYFSQDGLDLEKQSTAGGAASASVATLSTAMGLITDQDGDACLDSNAGLTTGISLPIITLTCVPNPTTGKLDLVSLVSWSQQANNNCGGPQDVIVGEGNASSKCTNSTTATNVTVLGQINITKVVNGVATRTLKATDVPPFAFTAANTTTPANAPTPTMFSLDNGNPPQQVATGALTQAGEHYLITETQDPAYILSSIVCTDSAGQPASFANINLANGTVDALMSTTNGILNCTYTNTLRPVTPAIIKSFNPVSILSGETTVLTYTISNPANGQTTVVGFTDLLPSGLQLANGTTGGTCAGFAATDANGGALAAGSTSVKIANLSIGAGVSCTIAVTVTNKPGQVNADCSQLPSAFTNGPGNVTIVGSMTNLITPSCVVVSTLPTLTKSFSPATIAVGGTTVLTFTLNNTQAGALQRTGVSFTDLLPAGLQLADGVDTGTCAYTITDNANAPLAAGSTSVKVTNLTIAANATCTIAVNVTNVPLQVNPSCVGNPANFTNTAIRITNLNLLLNGVQPSCVVVTPFVPTLAKSFSPNSFVIGGFTTLTFTITNPAANNPAQTFSFTDTLPAGLLVAATPAIVNNCTGGTVTAVAGSATIAIAGTTVGASSASASSCTISVNVTNAPLQVNASCAANPPNFTNSQNNVTNLTNLNNGVQPSCVTITPLMPTLTKSFSPTTINLGGTTVLTFTISNPPTNNPAQVVSFTDTLPSGLRVAATPGIASTCTGGTVVAAAGGSSIAVTGVTVGASTTSPGTCTIAVNVTNAPGQANPSCSPNAPNFTNTSTSVSGLSNLNNGVQPSCVVVNTFSFTITKSPSATTVTPGTPLSFTIVITNNGPSAADGSVITDPAIANYSVSAVTCVGTTGGATCPAPLTVAALQGSGMTVPTFPANGTITLRIDGSTALTAGSLTNTVTVSPPAGIPGVASASASATVAAVVGVIPTLDPAVLIVLLLVVGLAGGFAARRARG